MHPLLAQLPAVHVLAEQAAALTGAPRWALVEAARRCIARRREELLRTAAGGGGERDGIARAGAHDERTGHDGRSGRDERTGADGDEESMAPASPARAAAPPRGAGDQAPDRGLPASAEVRPEVVARVAEQLAQPSLRRVINATGVILHTNLGRAPLAEAARRAIDEVAAGYCNLEYELARGSRGSRHDHLREILCKLTGAEDAVVVNNNAAATVLGLAAMAAGRGVVVSRGELIEIGGSFRLPEILALSGCRMLEVGTTNKTRGSDYRAAVESAAGTAALLLKVHRSNFAIVGFTAEASAEELVALADELAAESVAAGAGETPRLHVMIDLGSGALLPAELQRAAGLPVEPTVAETVASGADLVSFSGDKLLGGPQAGILVGRAAAIARARKHPLMRMLRPDKLTLAALGATLACYRDGRLGELPALAMLRRTPEMVRADAEAIAAAIATSLADGELVVEVRPCTSTVGGGAMPTAQLPSWALALRHPHRSATDLDARLRASTPAIIGRIEGGQLWLDLRTVPPSDHPALVAALVPLR